MDLNLLNTFLKVYSHMSYTKASEEIGISQAAVSQQIKKLESQIDKPLFIKQGRSIAPTSQAIFMAEKLTQAAELIGQSIHSRSFLIYSQEMFVYQLNHLDLEIKNSPDSQADIVDDLRKQKVDLVIDFITTSDGSIIVENIAEEKVYIAASKNHPRIQGTLTEEQFYNEKHVALVMKRSGKDVFTIIAENPLPRNVVYHAPSIMAQLVYVSTSDKLCIITERMHKVFSETLQLQIFEPPMNLKKVPYSMLYHRRDVNNQAHKEKREMVKSILQADPTASSVYQF